MSRVALVSEARFVGTRGADHYLQQVLREDQLLTAALAELGYTAERVDWRDPSVQWSGYSAAVIRTTWDYDGQLSAYLEWVDRVASQTRLLNPPELLRWNLNKRYLQTLAADGVPVVPTRFIDRGSAISLQQLFAERAGWEDYQWDASDQQELVYKPVVSASGRDTYRVALAQCAEQEAQFAACLQREDMMVQPFMGRILREGEISLMAFDAQVSHAVRKIARAGEFRVQDDHGGRVEAHQAAADEIACAHQALAACAQPPAYARIDLVRDQQGQPRVMEVELVEPELFLRHAPESAQAMARAIVSQLSQEPG